MHLIWTMLRKCETLIVCGNVIVVFLCSSCNHLCFKELEILNEKDKFKIAPLQIHYIIGINTNIC